MSGAAVQVPQEVVPAISPKLPVPLPDEPSRRHLNWRIVLLLILVALGAAGGAIYWLEYSQPSLPPGIASGNGRLEADEIDISTKFAGRVAQVFVDEGDKVDPGQVVARMDTSDLEASLKKAQAQLELAQRALDEAHANVAQLKSQLTLAQQELDRTQSLVERGYATRELLDQRRQQVDGATAALNAGLIQNALTQRQMRSDYMLVPALPSEMEVGFVVMLRDIRTIKPADCRRRMGDRDATSPIPIPVLRSAVGSLN